MKRIEAIIKPYKLETLKTGLDELGITGMTIGEVQGLAGGRDLYVRGSHSTVSLVPRIQVTLVVTDDLADLVVQKILSSVRTGSPGDGIVCMQPVERVYRIRTGETDGEAL